MSDDIDTAMEAELVEGVKSSEHGVKRMRQRLGLKKSAVDKEVARALDRGVTRTNTSGRLRRTLDYMFHKYGHYGDYRVYRGFLFIFKENIFVTVITLTHGLHNEKQASHREQQEKPAAGTASAS